MKDDTADVLLVGGGIMSATLGVLLKKLDPDLRIVMVEQRERVAAESSDGWNNAGTGHAAYCELNYTTVKADGGMDISRALKVNEAFEKSLQFWSHLVEKGQVADPASFIRRTPHMSFVWGPDDYDFLKKRHAAMTAHPLFKEMVFNDDPRVLNRWMPLVMQGRKDPGPVAATRVEHGADVDFGALTRSLVAHLQELPGFSLKLGHRINHLYHHDRLWHVAVEDTQNRRHEAIKARFVFLGAGGAALTLLQRSAIPEAKIYAGFPVSGRWLVCNNPDVVRRHHAKVYGQAPTGAPPMSVPHLDSRVIDGKPALLFGPFAGMTSKFLKHGSRLDLLKSVTPHNAGPMLSAGFDNLALTRYLFKEAFQPAEARLESLRRFFPEADARDWHLQTAGQRVQVIKKTPAGSMLQFGTEVVTSRDGSLAALLGASPGASTSVEAMLDVIERCFSDRLNDAQWQKKLRTMIPSYGQSLIQDHTLAARVRAWTLATLRLQPPVVEVRRPVSVPELQDLVA